MLIKDRNHKNKVCLFKNVQYFIKVKFRQLLAVIGHCRARIDYKIRKHYSTRFGRYCVLSTDHHESIHTTLYGSAAGCRSIQKTCAFWKHGLTSKNIQSHLTYFCKSNINQIFTNGGGMIWGVRIAIFTEIRHLVEELITFLSIFGPQKLGILTARLNKSLSISTSIQWEGISVLKHTQSLHSYCENNSFWKNL